MNLDAIEFVNVGDSSSFECLTRHLANVGEHVSLVAASHQLLLERKARRGVCPTQNARRTPPRLRRVSESI